MYKRDSRGVGRMLDSDAMRIAMEVVAEEIRVRAEVIAPVYEGPGHDDHRGRYKASFHVKSELHAGATHDRAQATVYNDAPEAFFVEFGHRGAEPEHVLARAAFVKYKGMA